MHTPAQGCQLCPNMLTFYLLQFSSIRLKTSIAYGLVFKRSSLQCYEWSLLKISTYATEISYKYSKKKDSTE